MKLIKEDLQNVDSVENLQPVEEIVMADAQQTSKKKWKEVKDIIDPKERAKEKPFTGSDGKQPEPKKAEVPKPQLDESLFEDVDEDEEEVDGWGSEVEAITADVLSDIDQLAYEIRNCVRGSYTNCDNVKDLADYIEYLGNTLSEVADEVRDAAIVESLEEGLREDYYDETQKAVLTIKKYYRNNMQRFLESMAYNCPIGYERGHQFILDVAEYLSDNMDESLKENFYKGQKVKYWGKDTEILDIENDPKYGIDLLIKNPNWDGKDPRYENIWVADKVDIEESIKEAKEFDLWDRVYEELCPDHINIMKKTRFPEVTLGERYGQDDVIEVDNDDNIVVYGKDDAAFDFARKVCDSYGCEFDGPHKSAQYKVQKYGPKFALYAKVKIPY